DRVAVMRDGHIQQVATPRELYERPANRFVAGFGGTNNLSPGVCTEQGRGGVIVDTPLGPVQAGPVDAVGTGERCVLAVRPENVVLGSGGENVFTGRIAFASYLGDTLRYDVETESGLVIRVDVRGSWHDRLLPVGEALQLRFP